MKVYSKLSNSSSEPNDYLHNSRSRSNSFKTSLPKLRNGSSNGLNISGSSITTESSLLKMQDSFSGKPPRVPLLKTFQVRQKEKNEPFVEAEDDKFYVNEYRKHEIMRSRQIYSASFPFWFLDILNSDDAYFRKIKESQRGSNFSLEDVNLANSERNDFNKWLCEMEDKVY